MIFFLHSRFQGLYSQRDPRPGGRPYGPVDGFHVIIFQSKRLNDPRSQGAAIGRIRLRAVPDIATLYPEVEFPPDDLPRRRVFWREEMADEAVQARDAHDRGVADPLDWLLFKARMARLLAVNTFAKDLLEFGFNQGWQSGDPNWVNNAQPPITDLWDRAVPRIAAEGLDLLPYYEYKGAIGLNEARPLSLGWQRRAEKLYHNLPNTRYTPIWWTEDHNADLTDPDTLADARRLLDRTVVAHKGKAQFAAPGSACGTIICQSALPTPLLPGLAQHMPAMHSLRRRRGRRSSLPTRPIAGSTIATSPGGCAARHVLRDTRPAPCPRTWRFQGPALVHSLDQ